MGARETPGGSGCDRRLMLSVVSVGRSSTHRETPKVLVSLWLRDTEIFRISNSALKPQPLNRTSLHKKCLSQKKTAGISRQPFFQSPSSERLSDGLHHVPHRRHVNPHRRGIHHHRHGSYRH